MAEVVTVETTKPQVRNITLKLTNVEARDVLGFIELYYTRYPYMGSTSTHPTHKAISQALDGVKPKLDGINVANGKVAIF